MSEVASELYRELKTPIAKKAKWLSVGDEVWTGDGWASVTFVEYSPERRKTVEVFFDGAGFAERYDWKTRLIVR